MKKLLLSILLLTVSLVVGAQTTNVPIVLPWSGGSATTNSPSTNSVSGGSYSNSYSASQLAAPASYTWGTNVNPNGVFSASIGSMYNQFDTGTNFVQQWVKGAPSGSTNNWIANPGGGTSATQATNIASSVVSTGTAALANGLTIVAITNMPADNGSNTIYVSPNGNDSWDGLSRLRPVARFYRACQLAVAGQTIDMMPGTNWNDCTPIPTTNGCRPAVGVNVYGEPGSWLVLTNTRYAGNDCDIGINDQQVWDGVGIIGLDSQTDLSLIFGNCRPTSPFPTNWCIIKNLRMISQSGGPRFENFGSSGPPSHLYIYNWWILSQGNCGLFDAPYLNVVGNGMMWNLTNWFQSIPVSTAKPFRALNIGPSFGVVRLSGVDITYSLPVVTNLMSCAIYAQYPPNSTTNVNLIISGTLNPVGQTNGMYDLIANTGTGASNFIGHINLVRTDLQPLTQTNIGAGPQNIWTNLLLNELNSP